MALLCGVCNRGTCVRREELKEFTHLGVTERLLMKDYKCNFCDCLYTTMLQAKHNKKVMIEFKKLVEDGAHESKRI